jgi:hypothetical protein
MVRKYPIHPVFLWLWELRGGIFACDPIPLRVEGFAVGIPFILSVETGILADRPIIEIHSRARKLNTVNLSPSFNQLQELVHGQDLTIIVIRGCPNILCKYCHHERSQYDEDRQHN